MRKAHCTHTTAQRSGHIIICGCTLTSGGVLPSKVLLRNSRSLWPLNPYSSYVVGARLYLMRSSKDVRSVRYSVAFCLLLHCNYSLAHSSGSTAVPMIYSGPATEMSMATIASAWPSSDVCVDRVPSLSMRAAASTPRVPARYSLWGEVSRVQRR